MKNNINITLSGQFQKKNNIIPHCQDSSNRKITKYHTVRTVPTSMKNNKIPHCQDSSNIYEKQQNITLSGQFQKKNNIIPHCQDSSNRKITKYHTVRTVPTSMKKQCGIMLFFYWNCPDNVVLCYFSIGSVLRV
jgi:ribosomal protein S8